MREDEMNVHKDSNTRNNINDRYQIYYQSLLKCLKELDSVFECGLEEIEQEELHGHVIREIRRMEDILNIPHTHIELFPLKK